MIPRYKLKGNRNLWTPCMRKKKRKCDDALASHLLTHQIDYLLQDHSLVQEGLNVKGLGGEKDVIYRPLSILYFTCLHTLHYGGILRKTLWICSEILLLIINNEFDPATCLKWWDGPATNWGLGSYLGRRGMVPHTS